MNEVRMVNSSEVVEFQEDSDGGGDASDGASDVGRREERLWENH